MKKEINLTKKYLNYLISILLFMAVITKQGISNETKGVKRLPDNSSAQQVYTDEGEKVILYKGSYALIIGAWNYTNGWRKLNKKTIEDEINSIEKILRKQGFHIIKVFNPNYKVLIDELEKFRKEYGYDESNRLLFWFSGHGHIVEKDTKGYIVPVDAPYPERKGEGSDKKVKQKAISAEYFSYFAREIEAKHSLFLFNSCFSGAMFSERSAVVPKKVIDLDISNPARVFITAGSVDQPVPENNNFADAFKKGIEGKPGYNADGNRDDYITGIELYSYIRDRVFNAHKLAPIYDTIKISKKEGDFVFINKNPIDPKKLKKIAIERQTKRIEFFNEEYEDAINFEKDRNISNKEKAGNWERIRNKFKEDLKNLSASDEYSKKLTLLESKIKEWRKEKDYGELEIRVFPYAEVYLDGKYLDNKPLIVLKKVEVGEHEIKLISKEKASITKKVNIEFRDKVVFSFSFKEKK